MVHIEVIHRAVPETGSLVLLGITFFGLAAATRRGRSSSWKP